jgi:hypothetical protein
MPGRSSTLLMLVVALAAGAVIGIVPAMVQEPAAAAGDPPGMSLGDVSLVGAPAPCSRVPGHDCQGFQLTNCFGLPVMTGEFSVSPTAAPIGVLVIFSPSNGVNWWAEGQTGEPRRKFVDDAVDDGYLMVQVRWDFDWKETFLGDPTEPGMGELACRPATITRFLYDRYWAGHLRVPGVCGFCTFGGSGGGSQAIYPLTHYGAEDYLDAAIPASGPVNSAMQRNCLRKRTDTPYFNPPAHNDLFDPDYGFRTGTGPCANHDPAWASRWNADSVGGGVDYAYPSSRVHIILGENDTPQRSQVGDLIRKYAEHQTPYLNVHVVEGLGHTMEGSPTNPASAFPALEAALRRSDPFQLLACNNGLDDDFDGLTDFGTGGDPGCTAPDDRW